MGHWIDVSLGRWPAEARSLAMRVDPSDITNNHVVENALPVEGCPTVLLLFYNATLRNEGFDAERFAKCMTSGRCLAISRGLLRDNFRIPTNS
jgi:hypothetical protein